MWYIGFVYDPMYFVLSCLSINLSPLLEIALESSWKEPWDQESKEINGEINQVSHSQNPPEPKPCFVLHMHQNYNSYTLWKQNKNVCFMQFKYDGMVLCQNKIAPKIHVYIV